MSRTADAGRVSCIHLGVRRRTKTLERGQTMRGGHDTVVLDGAVPLGVAALWPQDAVVRFESNELIEQLLVRHDTHAIEGVAQYG